MITIEGVAQAIPAEPTVSPALPPGKVSHTDIRLILHDLRERMTQMADILAQTRASIESHSGQTAQGFVAAQQTSAAIQEGLRRIEALVAASL